MQITKPQNFAKLSNSIFSYIYIYCELELYNFYKASSNKNRGIIAGPGCSSIGGGAFTELGPFYPTGDARGLRRNPKSWNKGFSS